MIYIKIIPIIMRILIYWLFCL